MPSSCSHRLSLSLCVLCESGVFFGFLLDDFVFSCVCARAGVCVRLAAQLVSIVLLRSHRLVLTCLPCITAKCAVCVWTDCNFFPPTCPTSVLRDATMTNHACCSLLFYIFSPFSTTTCMLYALHPRNINALLGPHGAQDSRGSLCPSECCCCCRRFRSGSMGISTFQCAATA